MASIEEAVAAVAVGEAVLILDDDGERGDVVLAFAAEKASAGLVAFMVRRTSGLICLPTTAARLQELGLPLLGTDGMEPETAVGTIPVDLANTPTRGTSAEDRARTLRALADPATGPTDLKRPGHILPLCAADGGVVARPGHAEAAVDLTRLAGLFPAAALGRVLNEDGSVAAAGYAESLAREHGMPLISVQDLAKYRWRNEALVTREVETTLPTDHGTFRVLGYRSRVDGSEHITLVYGEVAGGDDVLTRVHSRCLTGDVLGSRRCDCGPQLAASMARIAEKGAGIITYNEAHEGRGIGIIEKLRAYKLQDEGRDTVDANLELGFPADGRHYAIEAQILTDLGVSSVRLLTNNPTKVEALQEFGVEVKGREPLVVGINGDNEAYIAAKVDRMGHLVGHDGGLTTNTE